MYRKPTRLRQVNRLVEQLNGTGPVHSFVEKAVAELEQGHYKNFVANKIAHAGPNDSMAQVAAKARQDWVDELHAKYF